MALVSAFDCEGVSYYLSMSEVKALCVVAQNKSACESMDTEDVSLVSMPSRASRNSWWPE